MLNTWLGKIAADIGANDGTKIGRLVCGVACALALFAAAGCGTAGKPASTSSKKPAHTAVAAATNGPGTNDVSTNSPKSLILQEGDTIRLSFPGAPNLDCAMVIRRDGKITLPMLGEEYEIAGKTPATVEAELKKKYTSQLTVPDALLTVQSSAFVVYVMGTVGKPGKLISDRPLNVLQAVIEAGVDSSKSDLKHVRVVRTDEAGHNETTTLNLYKVIYKGAEMPSFVLKPYDIINVPERFSLLQ